MSGGRAERIEAVVDRAAAAALAAAMAYALFKLGDSAYPRPLAGALSAGAAGVIYLLSVGILRTVQPEARRFSMHEFDLRRVEAGTEELLLTEQVELLLTEQVAPPLSLSERLWPSKPDELLLTELAALRPAELLLTDALLLHPPKHDTPEELVLDDILAELGPDSRVVRLFDPAAMATPGQLNSRIERHLGDGNTPAASPDASQALYDALAELRRSLG